MARVYDGKEGERFMMARVFRWRLRREAFYFPAGQFTSLLNRNRLEVLRFDFAILFPNCVFCVVALIHGTAP